MKVQTSPTSPKNIVSPAEPKVWGDQALRQPVRISYGRIIWLSTFLAIVGNAGMIAAGVWYIRHYPHTWLAQHFPSATTTVIQKTQSTSAATSIPDAVNRAAKTLYGLAVDQGATGVYTGSNILGLLAPLSNNGWLVTLKSSVPAGAEKLVTLPNLGQPQAISLQSADPASPFLFVKTTTLNQTPITIGRIDPQHLDVGIWVVSQSLQQTSIVSRHLIPGQTPPWLSSDVLQRDWLLDSPTSQPTGSAVVDRDGHWLGLLGDNNRVWPLAAVDPVLTSLVQSDTFDRSWLGLAYVDQSQAVITGQPTASGLLLGAASGDQAVDVKGPADKAGLKAGDALLTIDGQPITLDLFDLIGRYHPGDKLSIEYLRQGKTKQATVTVGILRR